MIRRVLSTLLILCLALPALALSDLNRLQVLVPGLVLHTRFAHDYGTMLSDVTYDGVTYRPNEATEKILPLLDWQERKDKLEFAEAWARVFGMYGSEVLEPGDARLGPDMEGPKSGLLDDGTFYYEAWVVNLRGRKPGGISKLRVEISPEANLVVEDVDRATR